MIKVEMKEIKQLEADLGRAAKTAIPIANRSALTSGAFNAREEMQKNIREDLINRNKFTERSVRVEKATGMRIKDHEAVVGSIADYMPDQEFGGVKSRKGAKSVSKPTSSASGEGLSAKPRTRLPRKPNKLANIRLNRRRGRAVSKKQEIVIKVRHAVQSGKRVFYHDFGGSRKRGIFRVVGGRKGRRNRGRVRGAQIRMIHDMTQSRVKIPKTPTLKPAIDKTRPKMGRIYIKALQYQINRQKLFR